ncbi:MAG: hypothetical protein ABI591_32540 [Kofleriaceae bacterium]
MKTIILLALASGCAWTSFDDLSDQTPVRAQEKPDGNKSSDYGTALVGATMPGDSVGGKLAVLSSGPGNYSTLELDTGGKAQSVGDSETLGQHTIDSITSAASLLFDGTNQVALIDNSNVGTVVVISGSIDGLSVDQQVPTSAHPDATAFVNGQAIVGVTAATGMPNVFSVKGTAVVTCGLIDNASMPLSPAAVAIDGTKLWAYSKTGAFFGYDLVKLDNAADCLALVPNTGAATIGAAINGAHIDIVASKFAVVTAYDSTSSQTGSVSVIDLTTMSAVGSPLPAPGVRSAAFNTFDAQGIVVLGYPNRIVDGTTAAGAVDLHKLDVAAGTLSTTADATLSIPGADSNHVFGRAVTTTNYNGKPIVVVAASNTVYSFYQTSLYAKR